MSLPASPTPGRTLADRPPTIPEEGRYRAITCSIRFAIVLSAKPSFWRWISAGGGSPAPPSGPTGSSFQRKNPKGRGGKAFRRAAFWQ